MKKNILIIIVLIFIIAFIAVACEYTKKDTEISVSEAVSENLVVDNSSVISDNSLSDNSALKDRINSKRTTSVNSVKGDNGEDVITPWAYIDQSLLQGITNPSDIPQEYIDSIISAFPELQQYDPAETSDNVRAWISDMGVEFYAVLTPEQVYKDFSEIAVPSWSDMFTHESTTTNNTSNATGNTANNAEVTGNNIDQTLLPVEDEYIPVEDTSDIGYHTGETGVTN